MVIAAKIYKPLGQLAAKSQNDRARQNAYRRGYGGRRWEQMRRETFLRDNYICQRCRQLCVEGHEDKKRWPHCDHIVPKSKGGTDDLSNRQTLCGSCHNYKTNKEEGVK